MHAAVFPRKNANPKTLWRPIPRHEKERYDYFFKTYMGGG